MNISQGAKTFTDLFPDMMKATKLLMIDHDVIRYHSFDLLRYTLFTRQDLFVTLKKEYRELVIPNKELAEQVQFMRTHAPTFNIFDMFERDAGIHNTVEYSKKVVEMLTSEHGRCTSTDVADRFDVVFDRPDVTGYLLRYKGETLKPSCYNKLTVYEDTNLLNLDTAIKIIRKHHINAVMICSSELAVRLAAMLVRAGYTRPITFIVARYGYNFMIDKDEAIIPLFNGEMGALEIQHKHEFGFFDPFSGLTYRFRYLNSEEE